MSRSAIAFVLGSLLWPVTAAAQSAITEQEAQSIAVDAYIYFYPLVTMDVTRKQLTNKRTRLRELRRPNEHVR